MKTLMFVFAVALAYCATTCDALMCHSCDRVASRVDCMQASLVTCGQEHAYCWTTQTETESEEQWTNRCGTQAQCAQYITAESCDHNASTCHSCCVNQICDTKRATTEATTTEATTTNATADSNVAMTTTSASGPGTFADDGIVTMATAALAALLMKTAGF